MQQASYKYGDHLGWSLLLRSSPIVKIQTTGLMIKTHFLLQTLVRRAIVEIHIH